MKFLSTAVSPFAMRDDTHGFLELDTLLDMIYRDMQLMKTAQIFWVPYK